MSAEQAKPAPQGSALRRWRKKLRRRFKHRPGVVPWLLFQPQRAVLFLLGLLPERSLMAVADRLGRLAWLSSRRRRSGRAQLRQAMPQLNDQERDVLLRKSCGHLGRIAAETMVASRRWPSDLLPMIQFEGESRQQLEDLREQGAVFVQAHLGSFEVGGAVLGQLGLRPAFPMRRPNNEYLARRLEAARSHWQVTLLARQGAVRQMLKHLKGGGAVILASDQNAHHAPVFPHWFGRLAATESAPVRLARRLNKPLVVFWCVRDGGSTPWRMGMEAVPLPAASGHEEQDDLAALEAVHRRLEDTILRTPEQYLWIHDRYRTRPSAENTNS